MHLPIFLQKKHDTVFAFCGFVRARARVAMAKVTGTKDGAPLDLRTENELVLFYSVAPSTTAALMAAVLALQPPRGNWKWGDV